MNPRFSTFMEMIESNIYPEPLSETHLSITRFTIDSLIDSGILKSDANVLDIGCGQGVALEIFKDRGIKATGITLGSDFDICLAKGYDVFKIDQNNMNFPDKSFNFIWARHVLEHSPIPLFTLFEYKRVLSDDGLVYVEVPSPGTFARHEFNNNHYSVFTPLAWVSLFQKAGFKQIDSFNQMDINLPGGVDHYYNFFLERVLNV